MGDPISRRERQIVRVLALLGRLSEGRSTSVNELAAEFRTRRETIYRDLRVLQDAGYPIAGDERGRLSRPRLLPSRVPEIRFSHAERGALLMALAQAQIALPDAQALAAAANKVKALAQSSDADGMFDTWICGSKDYRAHEDRIRVLIEAILRKRRCSVTYKTPHAVRRRRMISIRIGCCWWEAVCMWWGMSRSMPGQRRSRSTVLSLWNSWKRPSRWIRISIPSGGG